ncbi:hypothetical protein MY5147_006081 [Beauveria neobassiana]
MSDDDDFDGAPPRDAVVDRRGKRQVLATGFGLAAWANYMYPLLLSPHAMSIVVVRSDSVISLVHQPASKGG